MIRYRFYVGTTNAEGPVSHAECEAYLVKLYGGYSASDVRGAWCAGDGHVVVEASVVYEVLTEEVSGTSIARAMDDALTLCQLAQQESVLWTCERVYGGFASAQS